MRRTRPVIVSLLALFLSAPATGSAQAVQVFEDVALRVNLGDQLRVVDQAGETATGRLSRLTRYEIVLQTDAGARRFGSDTVREVAIRGHQLRKGALIGAAAFAVLGAVANCSNEGGQYCIVAGAVGAAPIGAGVGLAIGALVSRMMTIYSRPGPGAPVPGARAASPAQASLLEDLALRVNLEDQLRVEDESGGTSTGRLTNLTASGIAIRTGAGEKRFTRESLRQVAVRRHPLRMAVLIGAGAGAIFGAVAACKGPDREECPDAPILAGGVGAGLGLAAGALMHTTTVVYPGADKQAVIAPLISRGLVGARLSVAW